MTALLLAGLLVTLPEARASEAAARDSVEALCAGGAVVTQAELQAAGAAHLHDALRLAGVFHGVTVDGFDLRPVAAVGVPGAEAVRVFVDGAPAARGAGPEPPGLEALPVALGEVEAVVVCPGPGVAGGAFGGPWIDVRTGPPSRWAYGAVSYGNEAGDPGPALFFDPTLPNVDRLGPDVEAGAGISLGERTPVWAVIRHRDFLPTDPAIIDRTIAASVRERYPKRIGPVVAVALAGDGLRVRAAARQFADLPFVPEAAREIPLAHTSAQATVSQTWAVPGGRAWGHVHAAALQLERPDWSALAVDPDWSEARAEAALGAESGRDGRRLGGGLRGVAVSADGPGQAEGTRLADGSVALGSAWARVGRSFERVDLDVTASGAVAGSGVGAGLLAQSGWRPAPRLGVTLAASWRRTLPEETPDLAFWVGRVYAGVPSTVPEAAPVEVAHLRLGVTGRLGEVRLGASAEGQRTWADVGVPGAVFSGLFEADGTAAVGRVDASWAGRGLGLGASAHARGVLSGTDAYRASWRRLPRLGVALDATLRPDDRLALWARVEGRSGTHWDGFLEADLPAALLLDLGVSKRAWGERLRVSLAGRNVLGAEERTHPLGAELAPRLFVRLEGRL